MASGVVPPAPGCIEIVQLTSKSLARVVPVKPNHDGKRPVAIAKSLSSCALAALARPPLIAVESLLSDQIAKALTLPLISIVQSPAGIIIPAFAIDAADKTAPATVL